ncbi:BTAD domain-containing putative transcriptional regulator [Streptomyces sp. NPDC001941]|uniref:AfsR/SARP family transcriptional regulator n=1 Tax=Streptomyces sp. NPDC001941 TaxID=3154659 RepID=UPI00331FC894
MRFGVLGPLVVRNGEGDPVTVPETKVRALLADLLLHEGRPVTADRLAEDLWGDAPPRNAANALQVKVSQLRRALGRDRVTHGPGGYRIVLREGESDVLAFRALAARARTTAEPAARADLFDQALDLWRGEAFADFADEAFVREAATNLDEERVTVVEDRATALLEAGAHGGLADELAPWTARHPLRERLRALHLRALFGAGRQAEALAAYEQARRGVARELGVDPGPELREAHALILRGEPLPTGGPPRRESGEEAGRPPASSRTPAAGSTPAPPVPGNLPRPLGDLIGRADDLDDVEQALHRDRLVTLVGPGGVGKTRLALDVAARVSGRFPDGVWLVELAGLDSGAVVEEAVAAALGVRDDVTDRPAPAVERLVAALRGRRALLVLDNCEHLMEAVAHFTAHLLPRALDLRVLTTSREPLGVPGETLRVVEPLRPDDAAALFAVRAAAGAPGFVLGPENRQLVAEICRRLDGIPLALELAATRVRALGTRDLAARLNDRFRVLASGRRGAPARQQTLRAMIDWSWELLSAPERIVLRRLAVHHDGCTLAAAEAVCAGGGVDGADVPDLLARLVDRSLVVRAGERYRLLESVGAYARERLYEMADDEAVRDRHRAHYLALAERAAPELRGAGQRVLLRELAEEHANLRAAFDDSVRRGRTDQTLRLATALAWYWLLSGRLAEGLRTLGAALESVDASGQQGRGGPVVAEARALHAAFGLLCGHGGSSLGPDAFEVEGVPEEGGARARVLWLLAYGAFNTGDLRRSEQLAERALAVARATGRVWEQAAALALRSTHGLLRGELAEAARDGEESASAFRGLGDGWGELQTVSALASLAEVKGDYARSARLLDEGLRLAEDLGLAALTSTFLSGLGRLALLAGDWDRARALHERSRRVAAEQGFRFGEIHAELGLALGARRTGELDEAEDRLGAIHDWYARTSSEAGNHLVLAELGFVAEQRGDAPGARAMHLRALTAARQAGDPRARALALEGLAGAEVLAGRAGRATLLLRTAACLRDRASSPLPPAERLDVDRIEAAIRAAARAGV